MSDEYIVFKSLTYAYKAKNFLQNKYPNCVIVQTPRALSTCGCSYSIKVSSDAFEEITSLLKQVSML